MSPLISDYILQKQKQKHYSITCHSANCLIIQLNLRRECKAYVARVYSMIQAQERKECKHTQSTLMSKSIAPLDDYHKAALIIGRQGQKQQNREHLKAKYGQSRKTDPNIPGSAQVLHVAASLRLVRGPLQVRQAQWDPQVRQLTGTDKNMVKETSINGAEGQPVYVVCVCKLE